MDEERQGQEWARTAFHESGHATVALALGFPVEAVRVSNHRDGHTTGRTYVRGPDLRLVGEATILQWVAVTIAGSLAECAGIERVIATEANGLPCTGNDAGAAAHALAHLPHAGRKKALLRARQIAEHALAKYWLSVRVIAQKLDRFSRVGRNELRDIVANPRAHFARFQTRESERHDRPSYHMTTAECAVATRVLEEEFEARHGEPAPWKLRRRKAPTRAAASHMLAEQLTRQLGRRPAGMRNDGSFHRPVSGWIER